jgi:hypothetical protein
MASASETRQKSLITSLYVLVVIGGLASYFAFFMVPWPPGPPALMLGIAGIILIVSALPAVNARKPWTFAVLFVGTCIASISGILFEISIYNRMGLHFALIYPFGILIFGVTSHVWYLLKPQTKELFGISRPKPSSSP